MTRAWIALALAMAGCAGQPPETPKEEVAEARVVGRVATLAADGRYVLIQILGTWEVPDEALLQVRGADGRVASLRPTGERQGRYAAADILAGDPLPGDAVILQGKPAGEARSGDLPVADGAKGHKPRTERRPPGRRQRQGTQANETERRPPGRRRCQGTQAKDGAATSRSPAVARDTRQ